MVPTRTKSCNQLQQPQHGPVDVSSNTLGLSAFCFPEWLFSSGAVVYACARISLSLYLFCLDHFFLPSSPLHYHALFLTPVFCQLWPELNSEDQMDCDGQITSERQRWSFVLENLTFFTFNSSDCSRSAIWRGSCLQLHVTDILLSITILPVPAEHLVLALHLLPELRSQACNTGQETLFQHIAAIAFSASVVLQNVQSGFCLPPALLNSHPLPRSPPDGSGYAL